MFRYFVIGFVATHVAIFQLASFPQLIVLPISLVLLVILLWFSVRPRQSNPSSGLLYYWQRSKAIIIGLLFAIIWQFFQQMMTASLPNDAFFKTITVTGKINALPEMVSLSTKSHRKRLKLILEVLEINAPEGQFSAEKYQAWYSHKPKIALNWYLTEADQNRLPKAGEVWAFHAKLKPPYGSLNPGGFDYEAYLFAQGISARGYVVTKTHQPHYVSGHQNYRQNLATYLAKLFADSPFKGIFTALLDGDRSGLSDNDWSLLKQTGTIHLMAISGLHIGMMATIGFWLFAQLWGFGVRFLPGRLGRVWQTLPRIYIAAGGAFLIATVYMALAGFAIPTQRAWLMVVSVLIFVFLRRQFQPLSALALAAFLITLWQPASVLSQGFWLSFVAVAIIFTVLSHPNLKTKPGWQKMLWIQLALSIGLIPLLIAYYQQLPLAAFAANLIAVPFVTLVGLPLLFLTLAISFFNTELGSVLMLINDFLWQLLWEGLDWIQHLGYVQFAAFNLWQAGLAYLLLWSIFQALKSPAKVQYLLFSILSIIGIVAIHFMNHTTIKPDEILVTVLDVGQGQAVVFETEDAVVVYDTGAKWGSRMDGAKLAVLPYLKSRGHHHIDLLIVSHSDMDHAGGVVSLLNQLPVKQAVSGQPLKLNKMLKNSNLKPLFKPCENNQAWYFSQVKMQVLSPGKDLPEPKNDNDYSCVLKVDNGHSSVLVPGDLTRRMEKFLVAKYAQNPQELQADLLIAGHHGSAGSTSKAWLRMVAPHQVVFSSGFANRFHFPSKAVRQRLAKKHIPWRNTAASGAIQYKITSSFTQPLAFVQAYRMANWRWFFTDCRAFTQLNCTM